MKKTYLKPSTKEIGAVTLDMIAASPEPTFNPNEETETMESRRRRNVWDDESGDFEEEF